MRSRGLKLENQAESIVTIDRLTLVKYLKAAGLDRKLAEAHAEAMKITNSATASMSVLS